jgi:hypothetical protein
MHYRTADYGTTYGTTDSGTDYRATGTRLVLGWAALVLLGAQAAFPCTPVPSGLVSWWRAEGDAADMAGLNNGTLLNGTTFAQGYVGQAFSFNGVDSSVRFPDVTHGRAEGTIEPWFKVNSWNGGTAYNGQSKTGPPVSVPFESEPSIKVPITPRRDITTTQTFFTRYAGNFL